MKNTNLFANLSAITVAIQFACMINLTAQNDITGYTYAGTYEGHVYYLSDCTSNWYDANTAAAEMGGYLVTIADMDENNFVRSFVSGVGTWIGYQNGGWVNGEPLTFENVSLYDYEYPDWELGGYGVIFSNGIWALYNGNSNSNHQAYIVEFDSNPDCNNPNKTYVCHNGNTICVSIASLQSHLDHGDPEGPCGPCNTFAMQTLPDDESELADQLLQATKTMDLEPAHTKLVQRSASSNQIQVFPNPASSEINIMLSEVYHEGTFRILSHTGKEVHMETFRGQQSFRFDLSSFAAGLYLIDVRSVNGHYQKKFVKL